MVVTPIADGFVLLNKMATNTDGIGSAPGVSLFELKPGWEHPRLFSERGVVFSDP